MVVCRLPKSWEKLALFVLGVRFLGSVFALLTAAIAAVVVCRSLVAC